MISMLNNHLQHILVENIDLIDVRILIISIFQKKGCKDILNNI